MGVLENVELSIHANLLHLLQCIQLPMYNNKKN